MRVGDEWLTTRMCAVFQILSAAAGPAYSLTFSERRVANFTPAELTDSAISGTNVDPDSYVNLAE